MCCKLRICSDGAEEGALTADQVDWPNIGEIFGVSHLPIPVTLGDLAVVAAILAGHLPFANVVTTQIHKSEQRRR